MVIYDEEGNVDLTRPTIAEFVLNGAIHYAKHIIEKTLTVKKVFAIGGTGNSHSNQIKIAYLDKDTIKELPDLTTLEDLHPEQIDEFYRVAVLGELLREERELRELLQTTIGRMAESENTTGFDSLFLTKKERKNAKIMPGIYAKTHLSNREKISIIRQLFNILDIDYNQLQIDAVPPKETED